MLPCCGSGYSSTPPLREADGLAYCTSCQNFTNPQLKFSPKTIPDLFYTTKPPIKIVLSDNVSFYGVHSAAQMSNNYTGFCLQHKLEQNGGPAEDNGDAIRWAGLLRRIMGVACDWLL